MIPFVSWWRNSQVVQKSCQPCQFWNFRIFQKFFIQQVSQIEENANDVKCISWYLKCPRFFKLVFIPYKFRQAVVNYQIRDQRTALSGPRSSEDRSGTDKARCGPRIVQGPSEKRSVTHEAESVRDSQIFLGAGLVTRLLSEFLNLFWTWSGSEFSKTSPSWSGPGIKEPGHFLWNLKHEILDLSKFSCWVDPWFSVLA